VVKLKLQSTMNLNVDAVMEVLGNLQYLIPPLPASIGQVVPAGCRLDLLQFCSGDVPDLVVLELGLRASVIF
jgi:hypothetical protein